ncbi:MAG: hypothetical protein ACERJ1_08535 [Halodesulfovibrio sp.]|uniref:hypothetical protein n=1 Tax=Halodesulfovibrio sp. TaxID=1912772 RepID=UPI00359DE17A
MKLILKQYLASLKERSELDAILPDLLSQMGLNVFISPTRGVKEYGVDIAAVGRVGDGFEKVYLFSVKSGNLTRSTWSSGSDQALRPSLDEILDSFIPCRIPPEHQSKQIVICLCFGGDVNSGIRQEVTGYQKNNSRGAISFEEWNGDKLSELILEYLLKEELLPSNWQSMLRKSLALMDEPDASHEHFQRLARAIFKDVDSIDSAAKALNRVNLCLWVLFAWGRDDSNLESAYLSAEFAVLNAWEVVKSFSGRKLFVAYDSLLNTHQVVTDEFLNKCLIPYVEKKHAVSQGVSSPCAIDVNLRLFELLGRLAVKGQWVLAELTQTDKDSRVGVDKSTEREALRERLNLVTNSLKLLIMNNPSLLSPYTDSQAIDLSLALYLFSQNAEYNEFVVNWLDALVYRITFAYQVNRMYPCNLNTYEQLLDHQNKEKADEEYRKKVTQGSILYPALALFCGLYKADRAGQLLEDFANDNLAHSTLQYWYPNESTEQEFYTNKKTHGVATTGFPMNPLKAIEHVVDECKQSDFFWQLSAVKKGYLPLVLLACRYYRYPMPFHVLSDLLESRLEGLT